MGVARARPEIEWLLQGQTATLSSNWNNIHAFSKKSWSPLLIAKPLPEITEADLRALIDNGWTDR
jgi:hypothetical protein